MERYARSPCDELALFGHSDVQVQEGRHPQKFLYYESPDSCLDLCLRLIG